MDARGYLETREALAQAPFEPARWADALTSLASLCHATSAQLLSFGPTRFNPMVAPGVGEADVMDFLAIGGMDPATNHGLAAMLRADAGHVVTDHEYLSDHDRRRDPLYNEFFAKYDGHFVSSGVLFREGSRLRNLNLFHHRRQQGLGPNESGLLARLLPHFAKAVDLSIQLEGRAASLSTNAIEQAGPPTILCQADGKIVAAGRKAEAMLLRGDVVGTRDGRLRLSCREAQAELDMRIAAAARRFAPESGSVMVQRPCDRRVRIACAPVPEGDHNRFLEPLALLMIREDDRPMLDRRAVGRTFALTEAETSIAELLIEGAPSSRIAEVRGVSVETVNSQIKSILSKTGCSRRSEIPNLMRMYLSL